MKTITQQALLSLSTSLALVIAGCGPSDVPEGGDDLPPSRVAALAPSSDEANTFGGVYDVGVIPNSTSCPAGDAIITISMDDEDNRNANSRWGWLGAITSDRNTTFRFCRVDGTRFKPLATSNNTTNHYAVLKLGAYCPSGSHEFSRNFDNEDSSNANWYSGDIYPNSSTANTRLYFCLFRYGSETMSGFPDLGIGYGVFAASNFQQRTDSGFLHTDDEDRNNANGYYASGEIIYDAQRIIWGGSNTDISLARVR